MSVKPIDLTASEALYAFGAYLTTRDEVIEIGASRDASPIAEAIRDFCNVNILPEPRDGWEKKEVRFPVENKT